MSEEPACDNCRYFETASKDGYEGFCRRYAPRPNVVQHRKSDDEDVDGILTTWPVVYADDWCGEHAAKEAA